MSACSWTDSRSRRRSVRCVTCSGLIHSKTSAARRPPNISRTTVCAVAHISTGLSSLALHKLDRSLSRPLVVRLLLFSIPSPTHSFFPGLKPSFSANPSHCSPSFLLLTYLLRVFPGLFTVISGHICFLLLVFFLFLHFLVVGSVR